MYCIFTPQRFSQHIAYTTTKLTKKTRGDLNAVTEWITHAEDLDPEEEPTSENGKETTIS
jgi:hypothetical protein